MPLSISAMRAGVSVSTGVPSPFERTARTLEHRPTLSKEEARKAAMRAAFRSAALCGYNAPLAQGREPPVLSAIVALNDPKRRARRLHHAGVSVRRVVVPRAAEALVEAILDVRD